MMCRLQQGRARYWNHYVLSCVNWKTASLVCLYLATRGSEPLLHGTKDEDRQGTRGSKESLLHPRIVPQRRPGGTVLSVEHATYGTIRS